VPRITTGDVSNFSESLETSGYFTQKGTFEAHWPPKHKVSVSAPEGVATVTPHAEPVKSALKAEWVAYAESRGDGDASGKTKDQLIKEHGSADKEEGEDESAGTSSSISGSKPDKSGDSAPDTESSTQSPAPDAGSRSGKGRATSQVLSSSASSTAGGIRVTGPSQQSRSSSSGAPAQAEEATPDQSDPKA
jgi:hypothetical protein